MPAIRKGYRRIGGGALPRRILWAAGGMGVTVVANVLQKDGAHGAPYRKNNRLRLFAGWVRRAHQGILPTWSRCNASPVCLGARVGRV